MAEQFFIKRNWKLLLNIVTIIALGLLIILIWDQITETFRNLKSVNLWIISLMIPLVVLNYWAQAKMYLGLFAALGNNLPFRFMLRTSLELNFVNKVFPSGGVTGISYFGMRMRSTDITGGRATLVQVMKLLLLFISFEILLILGLLLLAVAGHANDIVILVGSSISTLLVVGTIAFVYVVGSERRIHATFRALTKFVNNLIKIVRPNRPETIRIDRARIVVQDIHNNFKLLFKNFRKMRAPFLWSLAVNVAEVLSIYAVYAAFGSWVNLGAVILAYAVANFAGLVSVLPGGIGIYEVLMTGVLTAAGVPLALSLPATVMFRVLSTLLQVVPGYFYYNKTVQGVGGTIKTS